MKSWLHQGRPHTGPVRAGPSMSDLCSLDHAWVGLMTLREGKHEDAMPHCEIWEYC